MNKKPVNVLFLAMVCLAGIALIVAQPTVNITSCHPSEQNITNTEGAERTFNVTINQTVNVSWLINGSSVQTNASVTNASYTNTIAVPGYWNVTAHAYNENSSDARTWWWTVTEDTTPPTVTNYAPAGTKVSVKTDITATFSEPMNQSTLNDATIIVCNSTENSVTGDISYDGSTVTFNPVSWLEYNETYNVTITTGVQDRAGNIMSSACSWNFTTRSEVLIVPIVICGNVIYPNGEPVLNPGVAITNLNTSENFTVKTVENSNYYRLQTDSTHIHVGDTLRFNATADTIFIDTVVRDITEADIESGGFRQNVPDTADLVITNCSSNTSSWLVNQNKFNVTYTVENRGSKYANTSTTTIYIDDFPAFNDSVVELAPGESYTNTVGPFDPPRKSAWFRVCADGDGAVAEIDESNNCMEARLNCTLPNLIIELGYYEHICGGGDIFHPLCEFVEPPNGEYIIHYKYISTPWKTYSGPSNTTINLTTISVLFSIDVTFEDDLNNGTISDDLRYKFGTEGVPLSRNASVTKEKENEWMITDKRDITFIVRKEDEELNIYVSPIIRKVREAASSGTYIKHKLGPFLCVPNTTFAIRVCTDADHEVLEANETDNCLEQVFNCSVSAWNPDLIIVKESISTTWIDRTNKTFTINYTVKNIGDVDAAASTTYVHGKNDPVPELAPGESHTSNSVGPFRLSGYETGINICADYYGGIAESDEDNNCSSYLLAVPKLRINPPRSISWIDPLNKTYNIGYSVCNVGYAKSNVSKVFVYVDGDLTKVVDHPPVGPKLHGKVPMCSRNTTGPFTMTGDNDIIKLCVKWEYGYMCHWIDTAFRWAGCLSHDNKTLYNAYNRDITKSCTFTGDVSAYPNPVVGPPYGLRIKANDITIDGNGSALIGCRRYKWHGDPTFIGIARRSTCSCKNVTIKNLEIREFHTGISIGNIDNVSIENCTIHDNGITKKYNYGITVGNSNRVKIDNCSVYNNTGKPTDMNVAGGHGINFDDGSDYCEVTNSHIFHNYLSGILASPKCKYLDITNNLIEDNGYCNESAFCAGVNLHWKGGWGGTTNSTVENNVILNNTGSGIYVTHGYTAIKNNTVKGSKNSTDVMGNGILIDKGKVTFLYNNTCCENEGRDIVNRGFATFGDDNTCDTRSNYNDDGTTRGCIYKCAGFGACIADDSSGDAYGCGDTVLKSCTFNQNVSCPLSGNGLIAGTDNITINGTGYTLIGNFMGIGILSNHSGVTIKNLQVKNFATGMKIVNVNANTIENCTVVRNLRTGINFSADNGTVRNSRIYDNVGPGIFIGGSNNAFENNTAARNKNGTMPGYGIYFSPDVTENNITANFIGDNEAMDIRNDNGATNTGDNNSCDLTYNYWDSSMLEDKKYGCTHAWTMPDLIISNKFEEWVDFANNIYNITYTIENVGANNSRPVPPGKSRTYLYIDVLIGDYVAADLVDYWLNASDSRTLTFDHIETITGDKDRIKVCADGADEVKENNEANKFYCNDEGCYWLEELFELEDKEANNWLKNELGKSGVDDVIGWDEDAACVGDRTDEEYKCGSIVEESCTFNGNMLCEAGDGLIIGKAGITIDGNGCDGDRCAIGGAGTGSGIYNTRHNGVTIKDLVITGFGDGIEIRGLEYEPIVSNTIDNCDICDNGIAGETHGINMHNVDRSTISNNEIYSNTGGGIGCDSGGNGIFMYRCCDNTITGNNDIHDNRKGGIFTKMMSRHNTISYNKVNRNGEGGIVLMCVNSDDNTIKDNTVEENHALGGIYINGKDNTIEDNYVLNNIKESDEFTNLGYGITLGGTGNKLYGNTVCGNEGKDIAGSGEEGRCSGNICDNTTESYEDENPGPTGCEWSCAEADRPDLTIGELEVDWYDEGSRTYKVRYTVTNVGNAEARETTTGTIIDRDRQEDDDETTPPLPKDGSYTPDKTFTYTLEGDTATIEVCADIENEEPYELDDGKDDTNNCLKKEFPPVLDTIKVSPSTAKLKVGETQVFTATAYDQNEPHHTIGEIVISWNSSDEMVGTVNPPISETDIEGNATTVFTANSIGGTTITAESGGISGDVEVTVWFEDISPPPPPGIPHGGPGGPSGKENVTGYEPGPGEGTGKFGTDIGGEQLPVNESETVSGGKTRKSGHPFGMGGEIIEKVKVVAPVFLVIMIIIVIALFYSGYFGEKRAHRRNKKRT